MIDTQTVERIVESANIVDVIGDFVTLKRRGVNYIARCPFHDEKTPSFIVSPSKNIFKCFGCGKSGSPVSFIIEHERLTYVEALKFLGKKYGIEIVEKEQSHEEIVRNNDRESMMIVSSFANSFFSDILNNTDEGKTVGLSYFKERGFSKKIIDKFQLGYSPARRGAFSEAAIKAGYKEEFLLKTGLSIKRDDGTLFDRFAGRVMFPIHSLSGRVIAFGGRILQTDKKTAKYLNSPDSDIYLKRNVLYGIYFSKQAISRLDKCYLVEGYTDVISLFAAGVENVVASSGTSLTEEQVKLISRFSDNVTVLFDGDAAGIKASIRGIDMLLKFGLKVKVVLLPEGEDPDSFAKSHNSDELHKFLESAEQDFLAFKVNLLNRGNASDPLKKAEVIHEIVNSISVIPDLITRSIYIKECSKTLGIEENVLSVEVAKNRKKQIMSDNSNVSDADSTVETKEKTEGETPVTNLPSIPTFVSNIFCQEQEKELLMFMLKHGREQVSMENEKGESENVYIDEYIIKDIKNDDLELQNLQYKKIFEEYEKLLEASSKELPETLETSFKELPETLEASSKKLPETLEASSKELPEILEVSSKKLPEILEVSSKKLPETSFEEPISFFARHLISLQDVEISSAAINLLTDTQMQGNDNYIVSKIWNSNGTNNVHIDLKQAVLKALAVYKSKILTMSRHKLLDELKNADENQENQFEILEKIKKLDEIRKFISDFLNRVVI